MALSWMENPTDKATVQTSTVSAVSGVRITMCLQPHFYRVRYVESCHRLDEVARRSS